MTVRPWVVAVLATTLPTGCGSSDRPAAVPKGCEQAAPKTQQDLPDGFPAGLLAGSVEQRGEQTVVNGFAANAPGEAARRLLAAPGVQRIDSEDDVDDAEASFSAGGYRYAFKFVRACPGGSSFTAVRVAVR